VREMNLTKLRNILIALVAVLIAATGFLLYKNGLPELNLGTKRTGDAQTVGPAGEQTNAEGSTLISAAEEQLILQNQEADLLKNRENLRRWPTDPVVADDFSGDAPKLAEFKGRESGATALSGAVVFLDYGHGGPDAGTVYPTKAPHDVLEKNLNLEIGKRLKEKLEAMGADVVELRTEDEWLSIYARSALIGEYLVRDALSRLDSQGASPVVDLLNSYQNHFDVIHDLNRDSGGGDFLGGTGQSQQVRFLYDLEKQYENCILVSLHCNYSEQTTEAGGIQLYYLDNQSAFNTADSKIGRDYIDNPDNKMFPIYQNYDDIGRLRLANLIYDTIVGEIPELTTRNAGSILPYNFAVLRCSGINSVLVEMGFLSNGADRELLSSEDGQERLSDALADSVYRYYCEE
jgi:N-acetylmuramoyl-L-alanine amidase